MFVIHLFFPSNFPFQVKKVKLWRKRNMFHGQNIQKIKGEYVIQISHLFMSMSHLSLKKLFYIPTKTAGTSADASEKL